MPIIKNILRKGTARLQNLKDFDVFIEETGVVGSLASSQYFVISEFPPELTTGNSSFKIEGSDLLKPGVELKTEILDSQGNPIFHYPIPNYNKELPAQRVGIEVYNDVVNGTGFLYVLGELDPKKVDVPQEFQGIYNVRFAAPVVINKDIRNTQPIKFFGDPTISVTENVKGVIKRGGGFAGETLNTITGSFIANVQEFNFPSSPPNNDSTFDDSAENNENILADTSQFEKVGNSQRKYAGKFKNLGEGTSPGGVPIDIEKQNVPSAGTVRNVTYALQSLQVGTNNAVNKLSGVMKGAELRITNPHNLVDSTLYPDAQWEKPTSFTSSIADIINDTTFNLVENYTIRTKTGIPATKVVPLQASASQYKIIYTGVTEPTEDTLIKKSFANITVGNLRTFSGDTYKSKIYMKEEGSSGGFEKIYDVVVEAPNQLVDQNSITGFKNVGSFHTQSNIENYWVSSSNVTASQHSSTLIDGVLLSGSNYAAAQSFTFITSQSYSLEKNESYVVEFNTAFIKKNKLDLDGNSTAQAELEVFLTGSAISTTDQEYSLGKVNSAFNEMDNKTSGSIIGVFNDFITHRRSSTPTTKLGFRVNSGQFVLQDVSLRPYSETNFSPGFFKANVPMPNPVKKGAKFDFLAEFYDANNNLAETVAIVEDIEFQGAPLVIQGTDGNALSGSMLIGQSIEMYGTNPAFLRSIGYDGFDKTQAGSGTRNGGFLLWSGSIGNGAAGGNRVSSSEAYSGVGLEILDASGSNKFNHSFLQFASNYKNTGNSRFRVQSSEFLLGVSGSGQPEAFISGSDGNLRISSSGFFLDTDGSINAGKGNFTVSSGGTVTLTGTITAATGGTIGGFNIGTNDIFAGNAALNNANTKIVIGNTDGTPKIALGGTADSITLTGGNDGVFMDGGGDFRVGDADGNRISFDQSTGILILSSSDFFLGSKANGKSFISSSAGGELEISSSFFHLSSSGHITGSKVLFDGGKIGGFTIGNTIISASTGDDIDGLILDSEAKVLTFHGEAGKDSFSPGTATRDNVRLALGHLGSDHYGIQAFDDSGNTLLHLSENVATIAGFTVEPDEIKVTNLIIDSNNEKLTIGAANPVTIQGGGTDNFIRFGSKTTYGQTTTAGVILGMDATVPTLEMFKNASNNFTFNNSGLEINAETFDLKTTPLRISSSNGGAIGIGATAPTSLTAGDGIFMSGSGVFRAGNADGPRVAFDGTNIILSSSKFMLGSKGSNNAYVSASGNNLEISASNFTLMGGNVTASNVDLSGKITATSGDIGGWNINGNRLDSTNDKVILDGNNNDGELRLGSSPPSSATNGAGIYLGGDGTFLVGDADGHRISFESSNLTISSSVFDLASTVSGRTLQINNTTPSILIESSSGGSVVGKVLMTANPGQGVGNQKNPSFVVSQSGMPIFSVGGEDHKFVSKRDVIVNSLPIQETGSSGTQLAPGDFYQGANIPTTQNSFENSSDTNTATAGGGAPTVKVANMLVASQFSASRMTANNTFFLSNIAPTSSANTKFNIHIDDKFASGSGLESSPAVSVFDIRRNYKQFNRQDAVPQAMVFSSFVSTELDAGADSPRFVPNGAPSGSAIFHFQSILAEGSAGGPTFADGKKCIVRIDSDVRNSGATETDFVFIEGRAASGSYTHPTSIWQIQADGDFVTRGDITAFGVNSNFNTVSDRRFKKDVHTISGSMNKILQLRPTEFTWIEKNKQDVGFIAQEVEEIIPEVINTATGMIEEGKETQEVKTISYPKLVPYLVDTIQVLTKRIEELEKKVK